MHIPGFHRPLFRHPDREQHKGGPAGQQRGANLTGKDFNRGEDGVDEIETKKRGANLTGKDFNKGEDGVDEIETKERGANLTGKDFNKGEDGVDETETKVCCTGTTGRAHIQLQRLQFRNK